MHTSNKFKENILLIIGLALCILAGLLRNHGVIAGILLIPGILALLISSYYTIKRRFSNLVANIKHWFS